MLKTKFLDRETAEQYGRALSRDKNNPFDNNNRYFYSAHKLWIRLFNYDKSPPLALYLGEDTIVSVIFFTLNKNGYANVYEIVTLSGFEGKGYASTIWKHFIDLAYKNGSSRLKISCTPSSIKWHLKNGLIFWSVDSQGSLKSDQLLFPTVEEQTEHMEKCVENFRHDVPSDKVLSEFLVEHKFSEAKQKKIDEAIKSVGNRWMFPYIKKLKTSLEDF
jgi:hypothetical protein